MQLRYSYRLYPSLGQRAALAMAFGCARVVFNDGLRARQQCHAAGLPYLSDAQLSAALTAAKATPQRAWLNEVSSVVLQQALADLNAAYRNFFASITGNRKGPKVASPRFRSRKDHRQAIRFTRSARFRVLASGKLHLPKIGNLEVCWSRDLPSDPSSVTVIKDAAGRYFASFVVERQPRILPPAGQVLGIDLGLAHFAVLSDGRKIASPRFLRRAEKKLKRTQQNLSRKQRGSKNRDKGRSAGKTRTHPGAARRSRNPPEVRPGSGVTGGISALQGGVEVKGRRTARARRGRPARAGRWSGPRRSARAGRTAARPAWRRSGSRSAPPGPPPHGRTAPAARR